MHALVAALALALFPAPASAITAIPECRTSAALPGPLSDALNHAFGFDYFRHPIEKWQRDGESLCVQGLVLDRNIYQYNRVFLQVEVRDAEGSLKAVVPLLFQMASIQAHHNENRRPWVALPSKEVAARLQAAVPAHFDAVKEALPAPNAEGFLNAARATPWGAEIDADSFAAMEVSSLTGREGLYLATWLSPVKNTGGSVFTQKFAAQALWLERQADGSWRYARSWGYTDLLAPLDTLLNSAAEGDDGELEQRVERLLRYSSPKL